MGETQRTGLVGRIRGEGKRYTQFHDSFPFPQESPHSKWEEALLIQCFHREQEKPALDLQNPGERVSLRHGLVIPAPMKRWTWGMRCNPIFGGRDRKTPEPHWPTSLTHFVNSR